MERVGQQERRHLWGAENTGGSASWQDPAWLVAVGLVALSLWQASEAIWGYRNREGAKRVRKQVTSWAMAVIYAALGVSAASVALGSGSSSSQSQQQATSGVLEWPAGRAIVVVAGLIIIGVGMAHVVKGREEILR